VALAIATALTVVLISVAYTRIIEHFPFGGGGYVVATRLLGEKWGLVSGSALLVDYVLTITTSVASGADQIFSFLSTDAVAYKLTAEIAVILLLVVMNLRGVKESVTVLAPIFILFLITHAIVLVVAVGGQVGQAAPLVSHIQEGYHRGMSTIGAGGMFALFLRAYSLGGGTYTGIEAVSNGLQIMREPKVQTGKRTMVYMAVSLAVTAGGIVLAYLLLHVHHVEGKTMNASLLEAITASWHIGGYDVGKTFVIVTLVAEGALLFVAAQAGFVDGPRVMANMAHDSWLPHRFSSLSDRLTMQDGVLLIGGSSLAALVYTKGNVDALVTMYSINVFVTFSLSQAAMIRFWWQRRDRAEGWKKDISIHVMGFLLCFGILCVTVHEKFSEGGWLTVVVTSGLVGLCMLIRNHYTSVVGKLKRLDEILEALPSGKGKAPVEVVGLRENRDCGDFTWS
jgi:amino acid transporter